ncbi:MAG: protein kinase, partial [Microbacteriaceae bacterium]|nr:protein kinase [Microbacteriaceae bacterium]
MSSDEPTPTVPRAVSPALEQTAEHISAEDTGSRPTEGSGADLNRTVPRPSSATPAASETANRTPADVARLEERVRSADTIPGYAVLSTLGKGGMGVVYKARHLKLNRVVALKTMLGEERSSRADLLRFLAEAEAVAAIKHPNVVEVYDYGDTNGRPFMALEFLSGGSLADHLSRKQNAGGGLTAAPDTARPHAQIARGVAAAHAQGIVHRDLKPANVLLDESGTPKVADFGLAKRGDGADVTQIGQVMGTPAYMSPEQAKGESKFVGPQADVWALGVMLYEALTGVRPFAGTVHEILAKVQRAEPVAPRVLVPALPRDLEAICLKCLAKEAHERYPTARELADDLDCYLRGKLISVRPAGPAERAYKWVKRNRLISAAGASVALALSCGLAVALWQMDRANGEKSRADAKAELADKEAARATNEASRATKAEGEERKRAGELEATAKSLAQTAGDLSKQVVRTRRERDNFLVLTAQQEFGKGNTSLARQRLDEIAPENRGIEWRYLRRQFEGGLFTLRDERNALQTFVLSRDGNRIATSGKDGTIRIWDGRTGAQLHVMRAHNPEDLWPIRLAFGPDG